MGFARAPKYCAPRSAMKHIEGAPKEHGHALAIGLALSAATMVGRSAGPRGP